VKRAARTKDPVALARELLQALGQEPAPANDDEPAIDVEALRARARRAAERMRRARNR
jgi:hypothetical protein